jgi:hypothetical protein
LTLVSNFQKCIIIVFRYVVLIGRQADWRVVGRFAIPAAAAMVGAWLLRRLKGESFPPQYILLPATFIHRRSTAVPPEEATPVLS